MKTKESNIKLVSKIKRGGTKAKLGSSRLGKKQQLIKTGKLKKKSSPAAPKKKRAQKNNNIIKAKNKTVKSRKKADGGDKTSRAKKIVGRQVQQDDLLQQARSNLITKLNEMDSKKREIIQSEQEKKQLLSALIAQSDADKTNTHRAPTINIIKAPEQSCDAKQNIECEQTIRISDDDNDDDVFSETDQLGAVGFSQPLRGNAQKRKSTSEFNLENSPSLKLKSKKTMSLSDNYELDNFSQPLAPDKRFSVHENPFSPQEHNTETSMFDTPQAQKLIKNTISKTKGVIRQYLSKLQDPSERKYFDLTKTGLKIVDNGFVFGHVDIVFHNDYIRLDGMMHPVTAGVLELILFKQPDSKIYTPADLENYKTLLTQSGAHLVFDANRKVVPSSRSLKYRNIIEPLFKNETVQGSGTTYIHWEDPNDLIER
jgi:hypothetical protein